MILDQVAGFAAWCKFYFFTLSSVTAVVVAVMAVVLFVIWWTTLRRQRWLFFLGAAFGAFALQYGVRPLTAFWSRLEVLQPSTLKTIDTLSWAFFSNLNSLLFLAAAFDLLCMLPGLLRSFRWRGQLIALFATSAVLEVVLGPDRGRYPDGALSAICIAVLGYALFVNSGAPGRRLVAYVNLTMVLLYAALHGVYLLVPWLSSWTPLVQRVNALWLAHTKIIVPTSPPPTPPVSDVLDAGIFGIAFIFKVALFLTALLVIVRCLSAFSPTVLRRVLDPVKARRMESLASQGILRAVGESIGSDLALLCFRLPGNRADEVMLIPWATDPTVLVNGSDPTVAKRPRAEESVIGRTLEDAAFRSSPDWQSDPDIGRARYWEFARGMQSFASAPLRFHGGVIGCLNVEWARRYGYGASDLHRIGQVTEFLIPGVQAERWLWALAQLRERLQHYNLDREKIVDRTFLHDFARELQDVLGALGILVILDFGFQARTGEYSGERPVSEVVTLSVAEERFRARFARCEIEEATIHLEKKDIGKILLAVHEEADPLGQPSLVHDPQQRKAVAVLVKDCALDAYRIHFRRVLDGLHADLDSSRVLNQEAWLRVVESALTAAGLPLVRMTATDPPSEESWPAERLANDSFRASLGPSLGSGSLPDDLFALFALENAASWGSRVLRISLPTSNVDLYLGIERSSFESELATGLPWTDFLLHLSEAADLALVRLRLVGLEIAALQFEVNELHVHELRGPATTISLNVGSLKNGVINEGIIKNLDGAAGQLIALAALLAYDGTRDHRASVPLCDVLEYVDRIKGPNLRAKSITFSHDVGQAQVSIPFIVASLVIMTLVRNATDAIGSKPSAIIKVSADLSDAYVECHVDDTGCGIRADIRRRVFEPGFTTKEKGSGRGLPLARQTMRRQKGDVLLSERAADGFSTRFTVRFPRSLV